MKTTRKNGLRTALRMMAAFICVFAVVTAGSTGAQAASKRDKAVKCYKTYLTKIIKNHKVSVEGLSNTGGKKTITCKSGVKFYVRDLNADKVPELVIKTQKKPYRYIAYTYNGKKAKPLAWISSGAFYDLKGKNTSFVRYYTEGKWHKYDYLIIQKHTMYMVARKLYNTETKKVYYFIPKNGKMEMCQKAAFNAKMKKYSVSNKTKTAKRPADRALTKANVKKYCK